MKWRDACDTERTINTEHKKQAVGVPRWHGLLSVRLQLGSGSHGLSLASARSVDYIVYTGLSRFTFLMSNAEEFLLSAL